MASYSRYSHHARRALTHATLLVQRARHPRVDTGHLLVGVMLAQGSIGATILSNLNLRADTAEPALASLTLPLDTAPESPSNDAALDIALDLAADESTWLGHHYIGTEHLLLGITRTNVGNASDLLHQLEISPAQVRRRVREALQDDLREFSMDVMRRNANFSELSRRVLTAAEQYSVAADHPNIGLGHLLFSLLGERRSIISTLLVESGLDRAQLQHLLNRRNARALTSIEVVIPPAVELSRVLGNHYTGTEHLLMVLILDEEGAVLLRECGCDVRTLQAKIERKLNAPS